MWNFKHQTSTSGKVIKYRLYQGEQQLTYEETIDGWIASPDFRTFYTGILADVPFQAFFWENPPVSSADLQAAYEFVLIDAAALYSKSPQAKVFARYFTPESEIVTFHNRRKDALLIVPAPISEEVHYTHLGNFVRQAPPTQVDQLWQELGKHLLEGITSGKKWFSTAGLGVNWLHIRIDSQPKYFKNPAYKQV